MILKKIDIYNFRQFCGKHTLLFGIDGAKKVVLIRGQNGSGKTTLLNAFWWCFYGETTDKFKNSKKIVSFKAIANAGINKEISCKVSVTFEHGDIEYEIERYLKGKTGQRLNFESHLKKPKVKIRIKNIGTGEFKTDDVGNPEEKIKTILPRELAPYFFFDGENLQHMTEKKKNMNIAEAIRLLTGTAFFRRATNDLIGKGTGRGEVKRLFRQDREKYGNDETKEVEAELEKAYQKRNDLENCLNKEEDEIKEADKRLSVVDDKLRNNELTKETQRNLELIRNQQKQCETELGNNKIQKAKLISEKACFLFLPNIVKKTEELIKKSKKDGLIPQGFKKVWIDKLLKDGMCICGEEFDKSSKKYKNISNLRDECKYDDIDEKIAALNVQIEAYTADTKNFKSKLETLLIEEGNRSAQLKTLEEKEDKVLKRLGEEAGRIGEQNLKDKKTELEKDLRELGENIGRIKEKIENKDTEIEKLEKKLKEQEGLDEKAKLATKRIDIVDRIGDICDKISNFRELKTWKDLQRRIQNTYEKISIKPFKIELSPPSSSSPYEFRVLNAIGKDFIETGESTGESQMLSLSFIGSLLDLAKKLPTSSFIKEYDLNFGGGIYPLVIDSPFGQIDNHYRPQIIEAETILAPQLILFVSNSQWNDEIDEKIRPYIFSEYLIKYRKPQKNWGDNDEKNDYSIEIDGENYLFVEKTEEEYESSEIERI